MFLGSAQVAGAAFRSGRQKMRRSAVWLDSQANCQVRTRRIEIAVLQGTLGGAEVVPVAQVLPALVGCPAKTGKRSKDEKGKDGPPAQVAQYSSATGRHTGILIWPARGLVL